MERSIPELNQPPGGSVDARVRRSQVGLRTALLDLLSRRTFEEITVREIADHAEIGYTTFFRHFSSKGDLLDSVIKLEVERLTDRSLPIYEADDGFGACLALCTYVDERRVLWSALLIGGAASKVRDEMCRQSRDLVSERFAHQSMPPDLSSALAVVVIIELLSWWLRQPVPWPVSKVAAILSDRIIKPLAMG